VHSFQELPMPKKIMVSVSWLYCNGDKHIGPIGGANLPADIFARFHRLRDDDVLMVSGSDTHGMPITAPRLILWATGQQPLRLSSKIVRYGSTGWIVAEVRGQPPSVCTEQTSMASTRAETGAACPAPK
jgi:hypothetical protein